MLVESGLDVIVPPDDESVSLVRGQVELYFLPNPPHLTEHRLDVVLLAGFLTDLDTSLDMV